MPYEFRTTNREELAEQDIEEDIGKLLEGADALLSAEL